jgi:glycosyltransferase involved in cell wall biosynthesis
MYSLDVIVPFFNEEDFLEESVNNLIKTKVYDHIYLVNNNSTDKSKEIALKLVQNNSNITYLETNNEKGKGVGLKKAIENINSSHTVIHDADLEYVPTDLVKMKQISMQNPKSLIIGSRFIGDMQRDNKYRRTIYANKFLSKLFSLVYRSNISDIATCYKLIPTKDLINMNISEKGFSVEIEIIAKYLKIDNANILEIPIKYIGRTFEEGKKISLSDGFQYLFKIFYYRFFKN